MSANVPKNEQGELQGALTSIMNLTTIIGPALMTNLFKYFTEPVAPFYFPGSSFFLGAILILIGVYIAYLALRKGHHLVVPSVEKVNRGIVSRELRFRNFFGHDDTT